MSAKKPNLKELTDKITELEEELKRGQADLFNIRRRAEEDKIQIGTFAKREVILALLPAVDNLERALKTSGKDEFSKGVEAVYKQFQQSLQELGLVRIKTVGEPFDPQTMEAVAVEGEGKNEIVSEELQAGYNLGHQNLRHAIVKVIKK